MRSRLTSVRGPTEADIAAGARMKIVRRCLTALCLALWGLAAQGVTVLTPHDEEVSTLHGVRYLEDPLGRMGLDDVKALDAQFIPWPHDNSELNFGFTTSAYWIRIPLKRMASTSGRWLLEVHYAKLHSLDFYPPHGQAIHTGADKPLSTRPYFDRLFVFPIEVGLESSDFYLRATSRDALTIPLSVWQANAYQKEQQYLHAWQFLYYGGMFILAVYSLMIYLFLRDMRFLIYCAYIVCTGLGMFVSNGYARQMLWPDATALDDISQNVLFSLCGYFIIQLSSSLLLRADEDRWLAKGMRLASRAFLLMSLLMVCLWIYPEILGLGIQVLLLNAMVMGLLISTASWHAYRDKREGVRFFVFGWIGLWLGVCVATFRAFGLLPTNGWTSYALQLSTVIELLFIALALAEMLRLEHLTHLKNQANALTAKQALLTLSQGTQEMLKKAVDERTHQLTAALEAERKMREQYVRFGSMISHEFRTPLSIIQSQASLMRKEHELGVGLVTKGIEAIAGAADRLRVMFDKWLSREHIQLSMELLELKPIELSSWLEKLLQTLPHLLIKHEVTLQLDPNVNRILADEYHLSVALSNLIDNAAKYAPPGSIITLATRIKDGFIGIAVTDQGPGIAQEVQDKVFADFFRASPKSHIQGLGLGLAIVQRIVNAHGGHIELNSTLGDGCTFCLWLPGDHPSVKDIASVPTQ